MAAQDANALSQSILVAAITPPRRIHISCAGSDPGSDDGS
jgi:hypothetical protein